MFVWSPRHCQEDISNDKVIGISPRYRGKSEISSCRLTLTSCSTSPITVISLNRGFDT